MNYEDLKTLNERSKNGSITKEDCAVIASLRGNNIKDYVYSLKIRFL